MTAQKKIHLSSGLTMAIVSVLMKCREYATVREIVEEISNAGRRTTPQEVSSLLVSIMRSELKHVIQTETFGRTKGYLISPEYRRATLEQLQRLYMRRVKYGIEDLRRDLGLGPLAGTEPETKVIRVAGDNVVFVLEALGLRVTIQKT